MGMASYPLAPRGTLPACRGRSPSLAARALPAGGRTPGGAGRAPGGGGAPHPPPAGGGAGRSPAVAAGAIAPGEPAPLIVAFHGLGGSGERMRRHGLEQAVAGQAMIAYPDGLP